MFIPNTSSHNIICKSIIDQAMHGTEEGEECLLTEIDEDRNTIAHLAVEKGRVLVFKVMIVCNCTYKAL